MASCVAIFESTQEQQQQLTRRSVVQVGIPIAFRVTMSWVKMRQSYSRRSRDRSRGVAARHNGAH